MKPKLATLNGETIHEDLDIQAITSDLHLQVGERKIDVSAKVATEIRVALVQSGTSYGKYQKLWPKLEELFGEKAFERGTEEYKACLLVLRAANPRWKESPPRVDDSQEAKLARVDREHCIIIASNAMSLMLKYRHRVLKAEAGEAPAKRGRKGFGEQLAAFRKALDKAILNEKLTQDERGLASDIEQAIIYVLDGTFEKMVNTYNLVNKPKARGRVTIQELEEAVA